jgi:hypothetical protein
MKRRMISSFALFSLVGCAADAPDGTPEPDGGPDAGMPAFCVEDRRVEVTDLSVPADGFTVAPQAVVDLLAGDYEGTGPLADGAGDLSVAVTVALAPDVPVVAVYGHVEGGGGVELGAPDVACGDRYLLTFDTLVTDAVHGLSAAARTEVDAVGADQASLSALTPLAEVGGDLAPREIVPEEWDRVDLTADLWAGPDGHALSLGWSASREVDAGAASPAVDTGDVSTGTVEPSGMFEALAAIPLHRLRDQ